MVAFKTNTFQTYLPNTPLPSLHPKLSLEKKAFFPDEDVKDILQICQ